MGDIFPIDFRRYIVYNSIMGNVLPKIKGGKPMFLRFERLSDLALFYVSVVHAFIVRPHGYEIRRSNGSVCFLSASLFRLICGSHEEL